MKLLVLFKQMALAVRKLLAPGYRPELYYMRGPGPASARQSNASERRRPVERRT
jgi:hypothetical protein